MAGNVQYVIEEPKQDCCKHWVGLAKKNPAVYPDGVKCQSCGNWHKSELKVKEVLAA